MHFKSSICISYSNLRICKKVLENEPTFSYQISKPNDDKQPAIHNFKVKYTQIADHIQHVGSFSNKPTHISQDDAKERECLLKVTSIYVYINF